MSVCNLAYATAGDIAAPPLVLGGSLGTTRAMWRPQVGELSRRRRVIWFDLRGHGGSPVVDGPYLLEDLGKDVLALLDHLAVGRVAYCGLSLGGMVGMWLASHAPERIERLVLICTSAYLGAAGYRERAAVVRAAGGTETVADAVVERWFTPQWAREHSEVVSRFRTMLAATSAEGYAGCCEAIASMDLRPDLERIAAPALVIAGAADRATPPEHAKRIADALANARLVVLDDAAHLANIQQADAVTRMIDGHIDP
jgi:3-oxoadipate enol-lactonase